MVAFSAGFAVVVVLRPDLVTLTTFGLSTTAGALLEVSVMNAREFIMVTTYGCGGLARLCGVGLGLSGRLLDASG